MALTAEQQSQVDVQVAIDAARHTQQLALQTNQIAAETRRNKMEAIRLAKETLLENARSKAVGERDVTAADITAFADTLVASANA